MPFWEAPSIVLTQVFQDSPALLIEYTSPYPRYIATNIAYFVENIVKFIINL